MKKCKQCGKILSKDKYTYCKRHAFLGDRNPYYKHGKTLIDNKCVDCGKVIKNIYAKRCQKCNYIFIKPLISGNNAYWYGKKRSLKSILRMSLTRILNKTFAGKNNPNWCGGISKEGYSHMFNKELKKQIRERDKYECQICGVSEKNHIKEHNKTLLVHHIDYNKKNCEPDNLLTLCIRCNIKVNKDRPYWKKCLTRLVKQINLLNLIEKIWTQRPELRLLQLIGNCYVAGDNYYKEDKDLEFMLRSVYIKEANNDQTKK